MPPSAGNWQSLDLETDPVRGDPSQVREVATRLLREAQLADQLANELTSIAAGSGDLQMEGDYASGFRNVLERLPAGSASLSEAYLECGRALSAYADTLEQAKARSAAALSRGIEAADRYRMALQQLEYLEGIPDPSVQAEAAQIRSYARQAEEERQLSREAALFAGQIDEKAESQCAQAIRSAAPEKIVHTPVELRPQLSIEQRKKILAEQIWRANNDQTWFSKYYRSDGHRLDVTAKYKGVELPILAKGRDGRWIPKNDLPSGPPAIRLNPSALNRSSVSPKHIAHLDKVAKNRRVAIDLSNREREFKKNPTAKAKRDLNNAKQAYLKQLGDRPNNSSIHEQLGEDATTYHVIPEKFPGAKLVALPKTSNGANMFDKLYRLDDGSYLIAEAKAPTSDLLWRKGAGPVQNLMVQQGTREYIQTIIAEMRYRASRSPEDGRLAMELAKALNERKLYYVLVRANENTGSYAGAILEHFKIY
jgi:uncharacterized protein YukE